MRGRRTEAACTKGSPAKDAVAIVSSCAHLPWMMEVCPLRAWLSTAFHTLLRGQERKRARERGRSSGTACRRQKRAEPSPAVPPC